MYNPENFIETKFKKTLRLKKQECLVAVAKIAASTGILNRYPKRPVFIIGSPRSGTSIFNKMLSLHPEIANLSEAIDIWEPNDRKDPQCDHVKTKKDVNARDTKRIKNTFGFFQFVRNRKVFMNKNPRNSVRIDYINAIFPDAKFIHIVRDGRAVVNSIIKIIDRENFRKQQPLGAFCKPDPWRDLPSMPPIERHSHQWTRILATINQAKSSISSSVWYEMRYEDLCLRPRELMKDVLGFLDLSCSAHLGEIFFSMPGSMNYKWRAALTKDEIARMNAIMGKWLCFYNYPL
jgi:hypothetical protein